MIVQNNRYLVNIVINILKKQNKYKTLNQIYSKVINKNIKYSHNTITYIGDISESVGIFIKKLNRGETTFKTNNTIRNIIRNDKVKAYKRLNSGPRVNMWRLSWEVWVTKDWAGKSALKSEWRLSWKSELRRTYNNFV